MKILQVNKFFYKKGGSETYYFSLRELLKKNGHEVVDFSMNDEKNLVSKYQKYFVHPIVMEPKKILDKIHTAAHSLYSFQAESKMEDLLDEVEEIEVAHLHNFYYQLSPSIISSLRRFDLPVVWTLHDYKLISPNYNLFTRGQIDESTKPNKYFSCVKNKAIKNSYLKSFFAAFEQTLHKKITRLYDKVDLYIAPSKFLADLIVEYGVPKEKVRQLYNYVEMDQREPNYEVGDYYLFVGRFNHEKGILPLLEEWKKFPNLKLKVIGGGELGDEVIKHEASNIEVVGSVYGEEMFNYLKNAKALIIPSVWYENNPIVALDAMSFGKPIIATNLGGLPELIEEGKSGMIYDPFVKDDFERAVREFEGLGNERIRELARRARELAEEIADPKKHYEKLMDIYEEAINKH